MDEEIAIHPSATRALPQGAFLIVGIQVRADAVPILVRAGMIELAAGHLRILVLRDAWEAVRGDVELLGASNGA